MVLLLLVRAMKFGAGYGREVCATAGENGSSTYLLIHSSI
jgi:hypothetical protein